MRIKAFISRNLKEIIRDPLAYIFCIGFPLLMLIIMTLVNSSIPAQADMSIFSIKELSVGICVFSYTFAMLQMTLLVSKDRTSSFLTRLYASPMRPYEFIIGYTVPLIILCFILTVIIFVASFIIALTTNVSLGFVEFLLTILTLIPSQILYLSFGLLFASLLNDKSAPPLSSVFITATAMLGGIWMPISTMNETFFTVCKILPFYNSVYAAKFAMQGQFSNIIVPLIITIAYMVVIYALAVFAFSSKMQKDIK